VRISLVLNGWPPLASHTAALLLGVAMANLSWGSGEAPLPLKPKTVTLTFGAAQLMWLDKGSGRQGQLVHFMRRHAGAAPCRLNKDPWTVINSGKTWVLTKQLSEAESLGPMVRAEAHKELGLMNAKDGSLSAPCEHAPRVIFGQSD